MTCNWVVRFSVVVAFCFTLVPLKPRAADGPILALFDMQDKGSGLEADVLSNLVDYLAARLSEGGYKVVPRDQIIDRLKAQKKKSHKSCFDQSCQIEMGRELAAQKSLSTKILRIGDTCQVTAVLYDLHQATTDTAATAEAGCDVNQLLGAVKEIAKKLCQPLTGEAGPKTAKAEKKAAEVDEFEKMMQNINAQKAKKEQIKKAWTIVKNIAGDNQVKWQVRTDALKKFLTQFKNNNPYKTEAEKLLAEMLPSSLVVKTIPPEAQVSINGQPAGEGFITRAVKAGSYDLVALLDGYHSLRKEVVLKPGQPTEVEMKLVKIQPGTLSVSTSPSGANISINGKPIGKAPASKDLLAGKYHVVAKLDGYEAAEDEASVSESNVTELSLSLTKQTKMSAFDFWGHVGVWGGSGLLAFGGISLGVAMSAAADYEKTDALSDRDSARTWTGMMFTGFILGTAMLATGITLWMLDPDNNQEDQSTTSIIPTADGQGLVFSFARRF
jgi:hypothetical protein